MRFQISKKFSKIKNFEKNNIFMKTLSFYILKGEEDEVHGIKRLSTSKLVTSLARVDEVLIEDIREIPQETLSSVYLK